jgi:TPR repeat protein
MRDLITVGCVALLLCLSLAAPAAAGPFEDGLAAYEHGDYATALQLLRPLAEQGNARAQYKLGAMYDMGVRVPQDDAEAVQWYRKAAERGNADAQVILGMMYDMGVRLPQDYAEAVQWYRKAAEQGNPTAQNGLAFMYERGDGVPQNYVQAHKWYNLATVGFSASESWMRELALRSRDGLAAKMTKAQITEAQRLASEWKPK